MSEGPQRRLAAIVSTDVVGHSHLLSADEDRTLRTPGAYCEVIDETVTNARCIYSVFCRACTVYAFPILLFLTIWLLAHPSFAQNKIDADLALVLAVDCSYSVDNSEFNLQMQGLAQAFASQEVIAAIEQGPLGRIAVMVVEWSGMQGQRVVVPWKIISDAVSARQLADTISVAPRLTVGITSISAVIDFSIYRLASSPVTARRDVIDISADGFNNSGGPTMLARDRAIAAGITINGLTILNEAKNLDSYFINSVTGGPGSFVMVANDYKAYGAAIKRKLLKEIEQVVS